MNNPYDGLVKDCIAEIRELARDAQRYRRLRQNWVDCDELKLHGRLSAIDSRLDELLSSPWISETPATCIACDLRAISDPRCAGMEHTCGKRRKGSR